MLDVLLNATYDRDICGAIARVKDETVRPTGFGFLGESVDHEIIKILYRACNEEEPSIWRTYKLPERIERVYRAISDDRRMGREGHAFCVAVIDAVAESELVGEPIQITRNFLKPHPENKNKFCGVLDELPPISMATPIIPTKGKRGGGNTSRRHAIVKIDEDFRAKRSKAIWTLHLGYLGEVAKYGRDEDLQQQAFVESVSRIMTSMGCSLSGRGDDPARIEAAVDAYVAKGMGNPLINKKATSEKCVSDQLEDAFCEYQPINPSERDDANKNSDGDMLPPLRVVDNDDLQDMRPDFGLEKSDGCNTRNSEAKNRGEQS